MYDYAKVILLGRATSDAQLFNIDSDDRVSKAIFTLAVNTAVKRGDRMETRTIFRRIMVLGSFANYVADCQIDGLQGRLINIIGVMDDEGRDGREIVKVAPGGEGFIKIMDRRTKNNG